MKYLMGLDGGGTKVETAIAHVNGNLISLNYYKGTSNPFFSDKSDEVVNRAISSSCKEAGISINNLQMVCLSTSGTIGFEVEQFPGFTDENFCIVDDGVGALTGALANQPGIIVIAGTGSMGYGTGSSGIKYRAGGSGPFFGDKGSGYDISRKGLVAVFDFLDSTIEPTLAAKYILAHSIFESCSQAKIAADKYPCLPDESDTRIIRVFMMDSVYNNRWSRADIAALFPAIVRADSEGDSCARKILRQGGRDLAQLALNVYRKMNPEKPEILISYVGGVLRSSLTVRGTFKNKIIKELPFAKVIDPLFSPVVGALIHAAEISGIKVDNTYINNIKISLNKIQNNISDK